MFDRSALFLRSAAKAGGDGGEVGVCEKVLLVQHAEHPVQHFGVAHIVFQKHDRDFPAVLLRQCVDLLFGIRDLVAERAHAGPADIAEMVFAIMVEQP